MAFSFYMPGIERSLAASPRLTLSICAALFVSLTIVGMDSLVDVLRVPQAIPFARIDEATGWLTIPDARLDCGRAVRGKNGEVIVPLQTSGKRDVVMAVKECIEEPFSITGFVNSASERRLGYWKESKLQLRGAAEVGELRFGRGAPDDKAVGLIALMVVALAAVLQRVLAWERRRHTMLVAMSPIAIEPEARFFGKVLLVTGAVVVPAFEWVLADVHSFVRFAGCAIVCLIGAFFLYRPTNPGVQACMRWLFREPRPSSKE